MYISATLLFSAQGALPKASSVQRTIQRERRKNLPPLPNSASEKEIDGKWKDIACGED